MKKKLPIGISDFKEIIDGNYTYVDKSLFIQEILERGNKVALIPRLRRFGKTLNLSMLRYFFEKTDKDTSYLFKDLNIWKLEQYRSLQGQFPVIFISFKDIKKSSWEKTFDAFRMLIAKEFKRHDYLLENDLLSAEEKDDYRSILRRTGSESLYEYSLQLLSEWLHRYHQKNVIILIDEYDAPAHAAYVGEYYDTLINFLRDWLSGGLKDNSCLEKGVLTGILRIAKESIFSGLNNITTFTILSEDFQDKFGLLEAEVKELLKDYDLLDKLPDVRQWYNGYRIGCCSGIYNPWSVLNCIDQKGKLISYWVNTSDNVLMKTLITQGSDDLKTDIEELLKGGVIGKKIEEGMVFSDLKNNPDAIWALLLFSGYLTLDATALNNTCQLRIPNLEVVQLYTSMILEWFKKSIKEPQYYLLLNSLITGDIKTFSLIFQQFLASSVSVFDIPAEESEKIYHAFILGMLIGLKETHEVKSNRESGEGRYDVMVIPKDKNALGIIMEFKKISPFNKMDLETAVTAALTQIEEKHYSQELLDRGIARILYIGFAFEGKKVLIRSKFKDF